MALDSGEEKIIHFRIAGESRGPQRAGVSSQLSPRLTLVNGQANSETHSKELNKSAAMHRLKRIDRADRLARSGLKKARKGELPGGAIPPTPMGCEWRKGDDGWNLWRCWSERDGQLSRRVRRSRYAGYLSNEAWEVLKEYDYETFLTIIGERLRRYGKR